MLEVALRFRSPTLDLDFVIARLKRHDSDTIAGDGVSSFIVSLPHFQLELGPAPYRFTLVVEIDGVVPHGKLIDIVHDFLVSLT